MKTIQGDLVALAQNGVFDVIAHGCNCFCTMGSGVAKAIRDAFPQAYEADRATRRGDHGKLGTCSVAAMPGGAVVNCYTQYRYGEGGPHLDYNALRFCLRFIKARFHGQRIGLPRIGAGLAGGDWARIEPIIEAELAGEDVTIVTL